MEKKFVIEVKVFAFAVEITKDKLFTIVKRLKLRNIGDESMFS